MAQLENVQRELLAFVRQRSGADEAVKADTDLIQSGLLDSLLLVDLVLYIEKAFGVAFAPEEVTPANFRSVASLAQCLHQRDGSLVHKAA